MVVIGKKTQTFQPKRMKSATLSSDLAHLELRYYTGQLVNPTLRAVQSSTRNGTRG